MVVLPTEAAIAAANANKGYSGSLLAIKTPQTNPSPRIAAGPVQYTEPAEAPEQPTMQALQPRYASDTDKASSDLLPIKASKASALNEAGRASSSRSAYAEDAQPEPDQRQPASVASQHSMHSVHSTSRQAASPLHVEESGASHTSSNASNGRSHTSKATDHKAALHAANKRLQMALQHHGPKAAKDMPAAQSQLSASSGSSPVSSPNAATAAVDNTVGFAGSPDAQGSNPSKADSSKALKAMIHRPSEASILSAESDDDANDLTGEFCIVGCC